MAMSLRKKRELVWESHRESSFRSKSNCLIRDHVRKSLQLESLEPRQLLTGTPIISEFMARNDAGLRDGDESIARLD